MQPELAEMIRLAATGDHEAQTALLDELRPLIRGVIHTHFGAGLRAREETQDLEQEIAIEILRALPTQTSTERVAFFAWSRSIAIRKIVDLTRYHFAAKRHGQGERPTNGSQTPLPATKPGVETSVDRQRKLQAIESLLAELPEKQALAVRMFHQGYAHEEIALALGCTAEAARKQVARGTAHLAKLKGRRPLC